MELLEEGSELLVDRGSVTFLTLTSSVTCPRLAGAFKFFATGPYLAVGVFVYLLADGFGAASCAPSATRSRASSGSKVYVGVSFLAPPVLSSPSLAVC